MYIFIYVNIMDFTFRISLKIICSVKINKVRLVPCTLESKDMFNTPNLVVLVHVFNLGPAMRKLTFAVFVQESLKPVC